MREIHTTSKPLLLLSQEQGFAFHFPPVRRYLAAREYERTADLMRRFANYNDGESQPSYWFSIYATKDRFRESFVLAYQSQFCFNASYLPLGAEDSELPLFYARALRTAIAGDYAESHRLALLSFQKDTSIGFPLLLAGVDDVILKRPVEARSEWISILDARRVLYPEQVAPSAPAVQAAEFLIHFRP